MSKRMLGCVAALLLTVMLLSGCAGNSADSQFSRYALQGDAALEKRTSQDVAGREVQLYKAGGKYAFLRQGYLLMAVNGEKGGIAYGLDLSGLNIPGDQLQVLVAEGGSAVALTMSGGTVYVWVPEDRKVYTVGQNDRTEAVWAFSPSGRYFLVEGAQTVRFDTRQDKKLILSETDKPADTVFVNDKGQMLLCAGGSCTWVNGQGDTTSFSLGERVLGLNAGGQAMAFRDGVITAHTKGQVRTLATIGADYRLIAHNSIWAAFSNGGDIRIVSLKNGKYQSYPVPPLGVQMCISNGGTRILSAAEAPSASVWTGKEGAYSALTWSPADEARMTLLGEDALLWLQQEADGTWYLYKGDAKTGKQTVLCSITGA